MEVHYSFEAPKLRRPAVIGVSTLDGMLPQHVQLVRRVVDQAHETSVRAALVLPWHPFGAGSSADPRAPLLTTLDERLALLGRIAPEVEVLIAPITGAEAAPAPVPLPDAARWWDVRSLVVIADEHDKAAFQQAAHAASVPVEVIRPRDTALSPQGVIALLTRGDVAGAAVRAGRRYHLGGEVIGGDRRGRLLGYPTANVRTDAGKSIPGNGVYAVRVQLPGECAPSHPAAASIGVRPTFGAGNARLVEVYLLDAEINLYGVRLVVEFVAKLRDEERFDSVEELLDQMARDVTTARAILADVPEAAASASGSVPGEEQISSTVPGVRTHERESQQGRMS